MELFARLFQDLLLFVYHCFDRVVIHGYLSGLSRPEQAVYFFRDVVGQPILSKEVLSRRTQQYQAWVEAYARNHRITIEWAEKGVRKEDYRGVGFMVGSFQFALGCVVWVGAVVKEAVGQGAKEALVKEKE